MENKKIEISPGATVSEITALYVKHTKWEYLAYSRESAVIDTKDIHNWLKESVENILEDYSNIHQDIDPILSYLGFQSNEIDGFLREFNGDIEVELDHVVLESNKFLPNRQFQKLDFVVGYTIHRN
tara:strand:+ start:151 stop:528 length:378 start_codon:yes stop_codon:yes gene_type:complete